jgi:hypothetical protein
MERNRKSRKKIQIKKKNKRPRITKEELRQLPFVEGWGDAFLSSPASPTRELPLKTYLYSKKTADRLTVIWPF